MDHVAAALGVPTLVLFGATSEVKNRPLPRAKVVIGVEEIPCRPCQMTDRWNECRDWKCMEFDPAVVAGVVRDMEATERGAG